MDKVRIVFDRRTMKFLVMLKLNKETIKRMNEDGLMSEDNYKKEIFRNKYLKEMIKQDEKSLLAAFLIKMKY
jgi:hypothetical protein